MSLEELYEWQEFYRFEPWGCDAEDSRWRIWYDLYAKIEFKPPSEPFEWLDRDPEETAARKRRAEIAKSAMTMEDRMRDFFATRSFRVEEPDDGSVE